MPAPWDGRKCWHNSSDLRQGEEETAELDETLKGILTRDEKREETVAKPLKESHQEASSRELEVIKVARQAYYRTHHPSFEHKVSHNLSTFQEMATSTNFLGNEIHEV